MTRDTDNAGQNGDRPELTGYRVPKASPKPRIRGHSNPHYDNRPQPYLSTRHDPVVAIVRNGKLDMQPTFTDPQVERQKRLQARRQEEHQKATRDVGDVIVSYLYQRHCAGIGEKVIIVQDPTALLRGSFSRRQAEQFQTFIGYLDDGCIDPQDAIARYHEMTVVQRKQTALNFILDATDAVLEPKEIVPGRPVNARELEQQQKRDTVRAYYQDIGGAEARRAEITGFFVIEKP